MVGWDPWIGGDMRTQTVVAPLIVGAALLAGCSSMTTASAPPTARTLAERINAKL